MCFVVFSIAFVAIKLIGAIQKDHIAESSATGRSASPGYAKEGDWQTIGNIRVRVGSAKVEKVSVTEFRESHTSRDTLLRVTIDIENLSQNKKADYRSWQWANAFLPTTAECKDDIGNHYRSVKFGVMAKVDGAIEGDSIYPGKRISDTLIFEHPVAAAKYVTLDLSAGAVGLTGEFKLRIEIDPHDYPKE